MEHYGSIIDGKMLTGEGRTLLKLKNPYNGEGIAVLHLATRDDLQRAIASSYEAFHLTMKKMPAHRRADILYQTAILLEANEEDFARTLSKESGKPIKDARGEVRRALQVLRFAAVEAQKAEGELLPMDAAIGGENRIGMVRRYPLGVIGAITPFNFPLNLVLHKVAPAIAAGNAVVLKPAEKTPLSALRLAQLFYQAGLPPEALQVLVGTGQELGEPLSADERIAKITFTGSAKVGRRITEIAGWKKVTLELGSNAANIVFADADLDKAATSLVRAAFAYSGQVCISAQRIYVQGNVMNSFLGEFIPRVNQLLLGDPLNEETDIGPMITEESAIQAEDWIKEAVDEGAQIMAGGIRKGQLFYPTVLTDVNREMRVVCKEIFAPVVSIIPFTTIEEVIELANDSEYGLQAGVFTSNIHTAFQLADQLDVGGVWINESSVFRLDHYPYGGVKNSGMGKEGVKYAYEDMTQIKFVGIKL